MKLRSQFIYFLFVVILTTTLVSCVKDVALPENQDTLLEPELTSGLVFFNLEGSDFFDADNNQPRDILYDQTLIGFLDDESLRDKTERVFFEFTFENTFNTPFEVNFYFKDSDEVVHYTEATFVDLGSDTSPTIHNYNFAVSGADLDNLVLANTFAIELIPETTPSPLDAGQLNLQSQLTYFLNITGE